MKLGHFHLKLARPRAGAPGKNIQDKLGTIQHLALSRLRKAVELRRGQFAIKDNKRGLPLQSKHLKLGQFAFAQNMPGMNAGNALNERSCNRDTGCARQFGKLVKAVFLHATGRGIDGNKNGPGRTFAGSAFPAHCGAGRASHVIRLGQYTGQFSLKGLHFGGKVDLHPIPCCQGMYAVRCLGGIGGRR